MAKMRVVVPNELDITAVSPSTPGVLSAIRDGVARAKTAVELAKRSLEGT